MENNQVVGLNPGESLRDTSVLARIKRSFDKTAIQLSRKAEKFIVDNKNEPFFLYYPTTNVHYPITPNEQFVGQSEQGIYGDFIVEFDWAVGRIMTVLDSLSLTENTLIFVTSDNGGLLYEHTQTKNGHRPNGDFRGAKKQIYEGGHRVPLIVSWPNVIKAGTESNMVFCQTDIMATCASIVGYDLTYGEAEDSFDFLSVLLGEPSEKSIRETIIHHSISGMFAIRKGDWKFVDGIGDGNEPYDWPRIKASGIGKPIKDSISGRFLPLRYDWPVAIKENENDPDGQLYNLLLDPMEKDNLYLKYPEKVSALKSELEFYKTNPSIIR